MTILLAAVLALQAPPQAPAVATEIDRDRVQIGDAITLTIRVVVVSGTSVTLEPITFDGFTLLGQAVVRDSAGGEGKEAVSVEMRFRADQAGAWMLGPIPLEVGPERLLAPEVVVEVVSTPGRRAAAPPDPRVVAMLNRARAPTRGDVAVDLLLSDDTVQIGEQVDLVTAAWFPRELLARLRRPPALRPPTVEGVYAAVQPTAAGVALSRLVNGVWYDLYVVRQVVFPLTPGEVNIPPASLAFSVPVGRQYFSEEEPYQLASQTATLVVAPLPPASRGTGPSARDLELVWEVSNDGARAAEPIEVSLVLTGAGNVALWPAPEVAWPDGSRGYVDRAEDNARLSGGLLRGSRRFRFSVIADSAGSLVLPEVEYPYFDLEREAWNTATARPVVLPVQPARPLAERREAVPLLSRRPVGVGGRPQWFALLAALAGGPLLALLLSRRGRKAPAVTDRRVPFRDRLRIIIRRWGGYPVPWRPDQVERALRRAGADQPGSADVARLYDRIAAGRFDPRRAHDAEPSEQAAEQVLARLPRRLAPHILVILLPSLLLAQAEPVALYQEGRYIAASAGFAEQAARQHANVAAWFGLGAAEFAAGREARAAAAWLQARRLAPRSSEVMNAWQRLGSRSAELTRAGRLPPFTVSELLLAAAALWVLGWLMIGLRRRRTAVALLGLAAACTVAGAVLAYWTARPLAVVARSAAVRIAPHGLADPVGRVEELMVVTVQDRTGGWRLVTLAGGTRGWLPATAIAEVGRLDSGA